jgi:hypothetical protein
MGWGERER